MALSPGIAPPGTASLWPVVVAWGLLLVAILTLFIALDAGHPGREDLFHPEAIYPLALFLDRDAMAHWATPYAPYYLPDLALYSLFAGWIEPAEASVYGFGVAQFLLFVLGARWSLGETVAGAEARRRARLGVVVACSFFPLAIALGLDPGGRWLQLFVGAFHTGAVIFWIWGLGVVLRWSRALRAASDGRAAEDGVFAVAAGWSVLLFWVVAFGVASDRLLLPLFVLPAAIVWGVTPRRPFIRLGLWLPLGLGSLLGLWLPGQVTGFGGPAVPALTLPGIAEITASLVALWQRDDTLSFILDRFFEPWGPWYRLLWLSWLSWTLFGALKARDSGRRTLHRFALLTSLCALVGAALIGLGVYGARSGSPVILFVPRYLLALHVLPLLTPVVALAVSVSPRGWRQMGTAGLLVAGLGLSWCWRSLESPGGFPRYRPKEVVCFDRLAETHGLKTGLMYFFAAQRVRVFSRAGLWVDTVDEDFRPMTWIGDRRRRGAESGYDFVVLDRLRDPERVVAVLGRPDLATTCGDSKIWIFDPARRPFW